LNNLNWREMKFSVTTRRVLLTFSLLLTFVFGAPTTAKAADLPTAGHLTFVICEGGNAIVFYGPSATAPATGDTPDLKESTWVSSHSTGWGNPASVTLGYTSSSICPGRSYFSGLPSTGTVTSTLLANLETDSYYETNSSYTYAGLGIIVGTTQYALITVSTGSISNAPGIFVVDYGAGGSGASAPQVTPMLPTDKPSVSVTSTTISCTLGTYSQVPTSAAFSLFVDGKHEATNFSKLGDYLPNWLTPWASAESISRTATLTGAEWELKDSYKGKSITCATLAYSKTAIGLTQSAPYLVAK
jgi:hypothetical protein